MKNITKVSFYLALMTLFVSFGAFAEAPKKEETAKPEVKVAPELTEKPHAILFKIHDITPIKNADDMVTKCEYTATFYNRTPFNLRQAKINLGWTDAVAAEFLIDEPDNQAKENDKNAKMPLRKSIGGNDEVLGNVVSSIDIPAIGSLKQMSVKASVDTDKCFVLLDALRFKVSACSLIGQENNTLRRARADASLAECNDLFSYVTSQDPEYYGEFKEISYSEQQELEKSAEEAEKQAIENAKKTIQENLDKTIEVLNNIK